MERFELTTGQQYNNAVNVFLGTELVHDLAITVLAIVEKPDSHLSIS
jgi:hypothetical protein